MMTDEERQVADTIAEAMQLFRRLPPQHPNELADFAHGVHECQTILMARIARRVEPEYWPIKMVVG